MELASQDKVVATQESFSMTVDSKSKIPVDIFSTKEIGQSHKVVKTPAKVKLSHRP